MMTNYSNRQSKGILKPHVLGLLFVLVLSSNYSFSQQLPQAPLVQEVLDNKKASQVKYALLYSFAISANWPDGYFRNKEAFVIGVTGPKRYPELLKKIQQEKKIQNLPVAIRWIENPEESSNCDLLFLADGTPPDTIEKIAQQSLGKPQFIVSENDEIPSSVAVFRIVGGSVRFALRPDQLKDRNLRVDPRLQRLSL